MEELFDLLRFLLIFFVSIIGVAGFAVLIYVKLTSQARSWAEDMRQQIAEAEDEIAFLSIAESLIIQGEERITKEDDYPDLIKSFFDKLDQYYETARLGGALDEKKDLDVYLEFYIRLKAHIRTLVDLYSEATVVEENEESRLYPEFVYSILEKEAVSMKEHMNLEQPDLAMITSRLDRFSFYAEEFHEPEFQTETVKEVMKKVDAIILENSEAQDLKDPADWLKLVLGIWDRDLFKQAFDRYHQFVKDTFDGKLDPNDQEQKDFMKVYSVISAFMQYKSSIMDADELESLSKTFFRIRAEYILAGIHPLNTSLEELEEKMRMLTGTPHYQFDLLMRVREHDEAKAKHLFKLLVEPGQLLPMFLFSFEQIISHRK